MKAMALVALFGLTLSVTLTGAGCSESEQQGIPDEEIAMFEKKLTEGATFAEACEELDVLCQSTGFGCTAHAVFCKVPTKDYICQQLGAACVDYPAACDVYNDYCPSDVPTSDQGVPLPALDAGPSWTDSRPPMKMDIGPMQADLTPDPMKDAGPIWAADCEPPVKMDMGSMQDALPASDLY